MTIAEAAKLEGVSTRHMLRYVTVGFKGHRLPAVRLGRAFSIIPDDYRQWRKDCGFDVTVDQGSTVPVSSTPDVAHPASTSPGEAHPPFPPFPMPADPHGVITNCPHPTSCNWPHPEAVRQHAEEEARRLVEKYRGNPNEPE